MKQYGVRINGGGNHVEKAKVFSITYYLILLKLEMLGIGSEFFCVQNR